MFYIQYIEILAAINDAEFWNEPAHIVEYKLDNEMASMVEWCF